jgi:hypothetical protein
MKKVSRIACFAMVGLALAVATPRAQQGERLRPPVVPDDLEVPDGNELFLVGHATGTQNYVCLPAANNGFAWALFTPQATLVNDAGHQIITHFFSPNPFENVTPPAIRPTWQDSRDGSSFWGALVKQSTDANFVAPGAVPWLLLGQPGPNTEPTGKGRLIGTTFIQRVNTEGGIAPATGCAQASDVGHRAFVPYTADYFFYREAPHGHHHDDR